MEKNKSSALIMIGVIMIGIIGIISLNILFGGKDDMNNNGLISNESEITPIYASSIDKIAKKYKSTEIVPVTKPGFKVGDFFEYKQEKSDTGNGITGNFKGYLKVETAMIFRIEGTERINKTDYYLMSEVVNNSIIAIDEKGTTSMGDIVNAKHYIGMEKGEFLRSEIASQHIYNGKTGGTMIQDITIPENMKLIYGRVVFFPWMLALTDDFKMETNFTDGRIEETVELQVIGTEKLNKRECFKVEKRVMLGNKVDSIEYIWVDKEKRIALKSETYIQNVKAFTVSLVSDIK